MTFNRGFRRSMERAAKRTAGILVPKAGLTVREQGIAGVHKTIFTFKDMQIAVTDSLAYASQQLYDFPAGRIYIKGGVASLGFGVIGVRADTINDSAAMDWSAGTAAASNVTLGSTMVDVIAKVDKTLDGVDAAYTTRSTANLASPAAYDGTGTAKDLFLNVSFPTGTDIDADGILKVEGFIEIDWELWGDV